jgi:hypothetical protein
MEAFIKIVVYVPVSHADKIREALAMACAGKSERYDSCSFSAKGVGRFRPLKGSNPFIGKEGIIETVEEERIEAVLPKPMLSKVLAAVKKAHPYEEPAIDVYPLVNPE